MGVREGGSYAADNSGAETLVERTVQDLTPRVVDTGPAPEVPTAPAAPPIEPVDDAGRGLPDTTHQE
ncbi:hypothetical protein [Methylobacterium sp. WL6]|uniref:hypothetical protein n=1 Tax=Methylobacterium sp. WL6 TaxID=2603901 RepID=UPI0011CB6268|nr:hypothetical protein [Methylobacterium sp. WL6]TXN60896.1 hypothetical protein FV230_25055 [Methylobacterium sp. WL6]